MRISFSSLKSHIDTDVMAGHIYQYRSGTDRVDSFMLMGFHAVTVSPVDPALKYSERHVYVIFWVRERTISRVICLKKAVHS